MCPLCLSTLAWMALGGGSAASLGVVLTTFKLRGSDNGDDSQ
jgi:hypothetical protein